jgi:hypothetical protein
METRKVSSGNLRSIGYDERTRTLQVELSDGSVLQYSGVSADVHRRFAQASSPWSFYRDNIDESFSVRRIR